MEPQQIPSRSSNFLNPVHYLQDQSREVEPFLAIEDDMPLNNKGSLVDYLWSIPTSGYQFVNRSLHNVADYFYEGSHIWKQEIYRNILEQTILGLKNNPELTLRFYPDHAEMCMNRLNEYLNCLDANDLDLKVSNLLQYLCDYSPAHKQKYSTFVSMLRYAFESENYAEELEICENWQKKTNKKPCLGFCILVDLSYARFNSVNMYPFCDYIVHKVINNGLKEMQAHSFLHISVIDTDSEGLNSNDFEVISHMGKELNASRAEVDWGKLKGTINKNFDPHLQNNPPFILGLFQLSTLNGSFKNLTLQRIGSPTKEGLSLTSYAVATPEFKVYLDGCKIKGKRQLYISLQSDQSKWVGYEGHRNTALKSLQEEYSANDTFSFVVLDQDSAFYHQKGYEFDAIIMETDIFIEQLKYQMFTPHGNFYFPPSWLECIAFNDHCKHVMQITLKIMFGTKPLTLDVKQRKVFLELYYAVLILLMAYYIQADNLNISCKDGIDRTGKTVSILIKIIQVAQGHANSAEHQRIHRTYTHAPALLVKKQAIIEERRERLEGALQWLDKPDVQKRIANSEVSLLPINYKGDLIIEKPKGQRPKENAYLACKNALCQLTSEQVQKYLLDSQCIDELITSRINQDLFIDDMAHEKLRSIFTENCLANALDSLALRVQSSQLIPEHQRQLQGIVTELLFITLIHSGCLNEAQNQLLAPKEIKRLLKIIAKSPEEIINRQTNTL